MDDQTTPGNMPTLLTHAEVADLLRVDPKTVTRWAKKGRLNSFKTPGGHRRYQSHEVEKKLGFTP